MTTSEVIKDALLDGLTYSAGQPRTTVSIYRSDLERIDRIAKQLHWTKNQVVMLGIELIEEQIQRAVAGTDDHG